MRLSALFGYFLLLGFLIWKNIQLVRNEGEGFPTDSLSDPAYPDYRQIVPGSDDSRHSTYSFVWRTVRLSDRPGSLFRRHSHRVSDDGVASINVFRQRKSCDYVVVLGSGLINGREVSVLLGNRIKRAIRFYKDRKAAGKTPPVLVFSGGQGRDEDLPEGEAMAQFAREYGIPESNIIVRRLSLNTQQNFEFSKKLMDERSDLHSRCDEQLPCVQGRRRREEGGDPDERTRREDRVLFRPECADPGIRRDDRAALEAERRDGRTDNYRILVVGSAGIR